MSLDRRKEPTRAGEEEPSGGSISTWTQLPAHWMKLPCFSGMVSDKRQFSMVVACGIAGVLLAVGVLMPGTVFRAFLPFLCGFFIAILLMVITVVYLILAVLSADLSAAPLSTQPDVIPGLGTTRDMGVTQEEIQEEVQRVMDTIGQELAQAPAGDIPPYPMWNNGRYKGWIWTLEFSRFNRKDTLVNWPPSVPGSCRWWASLQGSTLVLARDRPLPEEALPTVAGRRHSSGGAPAHELEDALIVREVDLTGCSVDILTEGLKGKSRWLRKSPLEIKHPERPIFEGQREVLLFAAGSAAKEQWFIALSSACSRDGGAGQAITALYSSFCDSARAAASVEYAQGDLSGVEGHTEHDEHNKGEQKQKKHWLHFLNRKERGKQKSPVPAKPPSVKKPASTAETQETKKMNGKPAVLSPSEMDQMWMGKGGTPSPEKHERQNLTSHPGMPGKHATEKEARSASAPLPSTVAPDTELQDMSADDKPHHSPSARLPPASNAAVSESPSMPALHGDEPDEENSTALSEGHAPSAQLEDDGDLLDDHSCPGSPTTPAQYRGQDKPAARKSGAFQRRQAAASLPSVPVESGVNLLLARVGFDVLRSAAVKQLFQAHIQRKLDVLRVPEYISSLEVKDVDMGCCVPAISNLKALPSPSANLWPQFLFDIDYPGGLEVIVEAKLELRDSTSWNTLDKAIKRVGGVAAAAVESHARGGAPAAAHPSEAAASSAEALSPRDSDDEDPTVAGHEHGRRHGRLQRLRDMAAKGIRNLAEITADHISKMHLRVRVEIHSLQGTVCAWVPPPPNDRLWFGFVTPPELKAKASPILNDDVRGRMLMYSYQITSVPRWVAAKLQSAITKNMTLPSCADIPLPHLLPIDHPQAAHALPAFRTALHQGEGTEAVTGVAEDRSTSRRQRGRAAAKAASKAQAASKEERKPSKSWLRSGGRKAKQVAEAASQDGAPAAAATVPAAKRASREEQPPRDMELSTFLTSEEKAEQGEELRTLAVTHGRTQVGPDVAVSDPLGATASTSLIVRDGSGSLAVTAVTGASGEAVSRVDTNGDSSSFSSKGPAVPDLALPALPVPVAVWPGAPSVGSGGGGSSSGGSISEEDSSARGADEAADMAQASQAEQALQRGSAFGPGSVTKRADGSTANVAGWVSNDPLDAQELRPASASHSRNGLEEEQPLAGSPHGSFQDPWSRSRRSASQSGGPWASWSNAEGSPGGDRRGQWREAINQGKKLATSLAEQAQEQVRNRVGKALTAAREKATKDEKRS